MSLKMRLVLLISLLATSIAVSPTGYMAMGMMGSVLDDEWPVQDHMKDNFQKEAVTEDSEPNATDILVLISYFAVMIGWLAII